MHFDSAGDNIIRTVSNLSGLGGEHSPLESINLFDGCVRPLENEKKGRITPAHPIPAYLPKKVAATLTRMNNAEPNKTGPHVIRDGMLTALLLLIPMIIMSFGGPIFAAFFLVAVALSLVGIFVVTKNTGRTRRVFAFYSWFDILGFVAVVIASLILIPSILFFGYVGLMLLFGATR